MPDTTFETLLTGQLREYAEAGVRPIDRFAIAEETIASGRSVPRWRRGWGLAPRRGNRFLIPLLVGLLLAALVGGALLVGSRLLAPPPLPRSYVNELVSAPDLPTPMGRPVLVPLLDGRVLVVGSDVGNGGDGTTTALLYDPATGTSVSAGPMVSADRAVSSAVRLKDGRVLILGDGVDQVFDPTTMHFTAVGPTVTPRSGGAAALLLDGRVLIAGGMPPGGNAGVDPALRSAELFDPNTRTSTPTGSIGTPTGGGSMVTLPDGRVFMTSDDRAEIYNPATGTFGAASATSSGGGRYPTVLPDGRVVLVGSTVQVWDPASRTFSISRNLNPVMGATLLDDGRIYMTGGLNNSSWAGIYDPTTGATIPTQAPRAYRPTTIRLSDGRVLIVGGLVNGHLRAVSTVQIFQ